MKKFTLSAMLLTIAITVDLIINFIPGLNLMMPFGGKFFEISLIPILISGFFLGFKFGIINSVIFAAYLFGVEYILVISSLKATLEGWTGEVWSNLKVFYLVFLDYVIPFVALSLTGLFFKKRQKKTFLLSLFIIFIIRLTSSSLSGYLLWGSSIVDANNLVLAGEMAPNIATNLFNLVNGNVILYSVLYNSTYLLTTFTIIAVIMSSHFYSFLEDSFSDIIWSTIFK